MQILPRYHRHAVRIVSRELYRAAPLAFFSLLAAPCLQAQTAPSAVTQRMAASNSAGPDATSSLPDAPSAEARQSRTSAHDLLGAQAPETLATNATIGFPDVRQRERSFLSDLIGPGAFIAPAFAAGIDTARPLKTGYPSDGYPAPGEHPGHGAVPEWGEGAQGYAKRYADRFGQGLVGTASRYALGEALRQDVTYHRCACTGLVPRTGHALASAYLARTRGGRTVPSLPALASPFIASEIAVVAWYPSRYNASDALRVSLLNYVAAPFKNLFTEFITK